MLEQQFRRYYREAAHRKGSTGENLLRLLGDVSTTSSSTWASVRPSEADQLLVSHKAIVVNGRGDQRAVPTPSGLRRRGRGAREVPRNQARIQRSPGARAKPRSFADWIDVDTGEMSGVFKRVPDRAESACRHQRSRWSSALLKIIPGKITDVGLL